MPNTEQGRRGLYWYPGSILGGGDCGSPASVIELWSRLPQLTSGLREGSADEHGGSMDPSCGHGGRRCVSVRDSVWSGELSAAAPPGGCAVDGYVSQWGRERPRGASSSRLASSYVMSRDDHSVACSVSLAGLRPPACCAGDIVRPLPLRLLIL